jgi:hypothetical protein
MTPSELASMNGGILEDNGNLTANPLLVSLDPMPMWPALQVGPTIGKNPPQG